MNLFKGIIRFELIVFAGIVLSGCVTRSNAAQDSAHQLVSPSEQGDGQATTVTAESQMKHEKRCVPVAESNRVQSPSVEMGVSRNIAEDSIAQPYTRFNCR